MPPPPTKKYYIMIIPWDQVSDEIFWVYHIGLCRIIRIRLRALGPGQSGAWCLGYVLPVWSHESIPTPGRRLSHKSKLYHSRVRAAKVLLRLNSCWLKIILVLQTGGIYIGDNYLSFNFFEGTVKLMLAQVLQGNTAAGIANGRSVRKDLMAPLSVFWQ